MARDQEQRLLAAHAAPERVHLAPVDPQPRQGGAQDLGHPREVGDLARVAPRVAGDPPPARIRVDDCEGAAAGKVAPEDRVRAPAQATAVRRDHERQRRVRGRPVPGWKHDKRAARPAVVGDVADLPALDGRHSGGRGRPAAAVADDELEPTAAAGEVDRLAEPPARRRLDRHHRRSSPTRSAGRAAAATSASETREPAASARPPSRESCRSALRASTTPARSSSPHA